MREKFVHDLPVFCDGLSVVSTVHVGIPISPPAPETFVRAKAACLQGSDHILVMHK
jgi:hypothetical protein